MMANGLRQMAEPLVTTCQTSTYSSTDLMTYSSLAEDLSPNTYADLSLDLNDEICVQPLISPKTTTATTTTTTLNLTSQAQCYVPQKSYVPCAPQRTAVFSAWPSQTPQSKLALNLSDLPKQPVSESAQTAYLQQPLIHQRRRMEWQNLDADAFTTDSGVFEDLPVLDTIIQQQLLQGDEHISCDVTDLDNYLHPSTSQASNNQPATASDTYLNSGNADSEMDPLAEFFEITPSTSSMPPQNNMQGQLVYVEDLYQSESELLERPQNFEKYCQKGLYSPSSVDSAHRDSALTPEAVNSRRTSSVRASPYPTSESVSDYRQKRDKNNISSARSRLKRQQKFQELKVELSKLEMRNVELRATLEILTRNVEDYKNVIMGTMKMS